MCVSPLESVDLREFDALSTSRTCTDPLRPPRATRCNKTKDNCQIAVTLSTGHSQVHAMLRASRAVDACGVGLSVPKTKFDNNGGEGHPQPAPM